MKIRGIRGKIRRWLTLKHILLLLLLTGVGLLLIALGTYEILLATESSAFCGTVCHVPMYPEYTTYQASPHSTVACTGCHVGAGSYNLINSKARGVPQIFMVLTNSYPRPILLAKSLRPARETCEKCHTPSKFTGFLLQTSEFFSIDEANTRQSGTIILQVGGGTTGVASGIHWHTAATVWYLPMDAERLGIGWVMVEKDGIVKEYINPAFAGEVNFARIDAEKRRMDCVDCHNRASHIFRSPNDLIDQAMQEGSIDAEIPYIKREALNAVGSPSPSLNAAEAKVSALRQFYENSYPQFYASADNVTKIDQALNKLNEIAKLTTFPEMRVDWNTHPDHSGHNQPPDEWLAGLDLSFNNWQNNQSEGCFRCHGVLLPATRTAAGFSYAALPETGAEGEKPLDANCNLCHYSLTAEPGLPVPGALTHTTKGLENCLLCHDLGGLKPFPEDHPWSNNEACVYCHQPVAQPLGYPVVPVDLAKNVPHTEKGLEDCLLCHGPDTPKPFKEDHPWASNDTCAACHRPAPELLPLPAAAPPPATVPVTPHSLRGLEDCLLCHGPTSAKPIKPAHPWSSNETCVACHFPAQQLLPLPSPSAPAGVIPVIPHSTQGLEDCLLCHGTASPRPFASGHPWTTNATCTACHVISAALLPLPPSVNQAPHIPHSTEGLSDCRLCHTAAGPAIPFPANHGEIPTSYCTLCHTPALG